MNSLLYTVSKLRNNTNPVEFRKELIEKAALLGVNREFFDRQLNVGFSGGEKKRAEILQLLVTKPKFAVLDETDSGLDIDSLKVISNAVNSLRGNGFCSLVITHYQRILNYLKPDFIHVLIDGKIVKSGDYSLAEELENKGYNWLEKEPENETAISN